VLACGCGGSETKKTQKQTQKERTKDRLNASTVQARISLHPFPLAIGPAAATAMPTGWEPVPPSRFLSYHADAKTPAPQTFSHFDNSAPPVATEVAAKPAELLQRVTAPPRIVIASRDRRGKAGNGEATGGPGHTAQIEGGLRGHESSSTTHGNTTPGANSNSSRRVRCALFTCGSHSLCSLGGAPLWAPLKGPVLANLSFLVDGTCLCSSIARPQRRPCLQQAARELRAEHPPTQPPFFGNAGDEALREHGNPPAVEHFARNLLL